jgi:hypothetical protein
MELRSSTRRNFLKSSATIVAAGWLASQELGKGLAQESGKQSHAVRLGAPVFDAPQDPEELALAHRKLGYRAAYCPGVGLQDSQRIRDIEAAFAKHDVVIAEVGRWVNLMDADEA